MVRRFPTGVWLNVQSPIPKGSLVFQDEDGTVVKYNPKHWEPKWYTPIIRCYNIFIRWLFPRQFRNLDNEAGIFGFVKQINKDGTVVIDLA